MEQESYVFEEGNALFLKRNFSNSNVYVISHSLDSVSLNLSVENNTEKFEKEAASKSKRYKWSKINKLCNTLSNISKIYQWILQITSIMSALSVRICKPSPLMASQAFLSPTSFKRRINRKSINQAKAPKFSRETVRCDFIDLFWKSHLILFTLSY